MSAGKMTPDEFKRIYKAFRESLKRYDGSDLTETRKLVFGKEIIIPDRLDVNKAMGGPGKTSFRIPDGEWSLIKAIQEGK